MIAICWHSIGTHRTEIYTTPIWLYYTSIFLSSWSCATGDLYYLIVFTDKWNKSGLCKIWPIITKCIFLHYNSFWNNVWFLRPIYINILFVYKRAVVLYHSDRFKIFAFRKIYKEFKNLTENVIVQYSL